MANTILKKAINFLAKELSRFFIAALFIFAFSYFLSINFRLLFGVYLTITVYHVVERISITVFEEGK